ncbi:hypothetical protein ACNQGL_07710 [Flavobacterium sp. LB3P21]|uniref:hypothetical protein n=1 Tax=Flavobacterium sp. LB3P21 TaxID=3401719 RepID=UPI003AAFBB7E
MYELLQLIAINNNWVFEYSRSDYQNLYNGMEISKIHLFVDPITIDSQFSDSGSETKTYTGKFMLLVSSDVDEAYLTKYVDHIKPLITDSTQIIKDSILCSDYEINKFQTVEVINLFDVNLDGILVNYSITIID